MSEQKRASNEKERNPSPVLEEPTRTPGRAEGDERENGPSKGKEISGPAAQEQERCREEPKRTPGKAEG